MDGDLEFTLGSSVVTVVGTSFVARCGEAAQTAKAVHGKSE